MSTITIESPGKMQGPYTDEQQRRAALEIGGCALLNLAKNKELDYADLIRHSSNIIEALHRAVENERKGMGMEQECQHLKTLNRWRRWLFRLVHQKPTDKQLRSVIAQFGHACDIIETLITKGHTDFTMEEAFRFKVCGRCEHYKVFSSKQHWCDVLLTHVNGGKECLICTRLGFDPWIAQEALENERKVQGGVQSE